MKTSQEFGHETTPAGSFAVWFPPVLRKFDPAQAVIAFRKMAALASSSLDGGAWLRAADELEAQIAAGAGAGGGVACGAPARAGTVPLGNTGTTTLGDAQ